MCVGTQGADQAFFRDLAAYLKNEGAANDGRHSAIPHVFWCAPAASAGACIALRGGGAGAAAEACMT